MANFKNDLQLNNQDLQEILTACQNLPTEEELIPEVGELLPDLTNPASAADILTGKQAFDENGNQISGSMINNGAVSKTLSAGSSYIIPAGFHSGSGKITNAVTNQGYQHYLGTFESAAFSNETSFTTPTLNFTPEGIIIICLETWNQSYSNTVVTLYQTKDNTQSNCISHSNSGYGAISSSGYSVSWGANSVTVNLTNYSFLHYTHYGNHGDHFYMVWGK